MKKRESMQFMNMDDSEFNEYLKSEKYFENHWTLYTHIISTTIHSMSLIESLLNDFITNYYSISKNIQVDFVDTLLTKITLRDKYNIFMKLIKKMMIHDPDGFKIKIEKMTKLIDYRNVLSHSHLDDNYKDLNELEKKNRIKLKYYNFKENVSDTHYIDINQHNEKLEIFQEVYNSLKMFMIQVFRETKLLRDKNNVKKV
jgi:hypothetical protein